MCPPPDFEMRVLATGALISADHEDGVPNATVAVVKTRASRRELVSLNAHHDPSRGPGASGPGRPGALRRMTWSCRQAFQGTGYRQNLCCESSQPHQNQQIAQPVDPRSQLSHRTTQTEPMSVHLRQARPLMWKRPVLDELRRQISECGSNHHHRQSSLFCSTPQTLTPGQTWYLSTRSPLARVPLGVAFKTLRKELDRNDEQNGTTLGLRTLRLRSVGRSVGWSGVRAGGWSVGRSDGRAVGHSAGRSVRRAVVRSGGPSAERGE